MDARSLAATWVSEVLFGRSLVSAVCANEIAQLSTRDRRFAQELAYGTLRWWPRLDWYLMQLLKKNGLRPQDQDVRALLAIGLYQLTELDTPEHAAVAATVEAVRRLGKGWATGLVNGVLRSFLRQRQGLTGRAATNDVSRLAHPRWLLDQMRLDWPEDWTRIAMSNNEHPPMTLRVNPRESTGTAYISRLKSDGISAEPCAGTGQAIRLSQPMDVQNVPGFTEGVVSVQDAAAQLAAPALDLRPRQRVLDACAAPGGKTCHLLEVEPDLATVVALDISPTRLARVNENLKRLRLHADVVLGDASQPSTWWDGQLFDRILLDAPCSATGVIRRHPDIKLLRKTTDIANLCQQQAGLLTALWPLLASKGKLLYVTCSVLACENRQQIEEFCRGRTDVRWIPISGTAFEDVRAHEGLDLQILPGQSGMDGFYYALLSKVE